MIRKAVLGALVIVATLATLVAVLHAVGPVGVFGNQLLIKDGGTSYRLVWSAKDANIDPTLFPAVANGGSVFFTVDATPRRFGQASLPASGWSAQKKGALKYADKTQANGPITAAKVKAGALSVAVKGSQVLIPMLNAPQASRIAIQLNSTGGASFCSLFPGQQGLVKKNDPTTGAFLALHAEANTSPCSMLID